MKISIPRLLAFNGGYVDTAGFLALQGLFTAHVTGNFVTLGAALVQGTSGIAAKLLALPVFCIMVLVVRFLSKPVEEGALRVLLVVKLLLFVAGAVMAIKFGPFPDGDSAPALATGLTLVAAMAIQNAVHRIYFPKAPPSTLMTGSTTQIMLDAADLLRGGDPAETRSATRARSLSMLYSVVIFAVGCGIAAVVYANLGMPVFLLPPVITALVLRLHLRAPRA
ncbi:MAG TPA: YoaK family protein [Bordetella sp.]